MKKLLLIVVGLAILVAGCNRGDDSAGTTTTAPGAAATTTTTVGAGPGDSTTTSTTSVPDTTATPALPGYTIYDRFDTGTGQRVVVLLAAGTYTDVDLEGVIQDVIETEEARAGDAVEEVHVADNAATAQALVVSPGVVETDTELSAHYLAKLVDFNRIVFLGPFADVGEIVIGS